MSVGESSIHRGLEPHAVKIINLKTNRFAMKLRIGYPDRRSEMNMLAANIGSADAHGRRRRP